MLFRSWLKTDEYPFNPFDGDCSTEGFKIAKAAALKATNSYLKANMRFASALEDWSE